MQITVEPRENFTILHLRGEFDTFYCSRRLQQEIDSLIAAGVTRASPSTCGSSSSSTRRPSGRSSRPRRSSPPTAGKLVIARPSTFCRDIIEKVGLDRVVPIYDTDEAAGQALVGAAGEPGARRGRRGRARGRDGDPLLAHRPRARRALHPRGLRSKANPVHGHSFGSTWRGVGRMSALDSDGLRFTWNGGNTGLSRPSRWDRCSPSARTSTVKFRLPLLQKGHCEAIVTISEVEERPDGVKLADELQRDRAGDAPGRAAVRGGHGVPEEGAPPGHAGLTGGAGSGANRSLLRAP